MRAIIMMASLLCASISANAEPRTQWIGENESIPACKSAKALRDCDASDSKREEMYRSGECKTIRGRTKWHYLASGGMLGGIAFVRFFPENEPASTGWVYAKALEDRSVPNQPSSKARPAKISEQAEGHRPCSE
ncbi:MAG: hypothetical protein ISN28_13535 [Ectothiorhodospiraceae bacterium AqS1]|nr:hypothetical protein [Ectothiorhodospiraceae bacterium AqS1]